MVGWKLNTMAWLLDHYVHRLELQKGSLVKDESFHTAIF